MPHLTTDVKSIPDLLRSAKVYAFAAEDAINSNEPRNGEVATALAALSTAQSTLVLALIAQKAPESR